LERVHVVLANTVTDKDYDGRFSHDNRNWAKTIQLPDMTKEQRSAFVCETHPAILDGFINRVREQQRNLMEHTHSAPERQKEADKSTHTAPDNQRKKKPSVIKPLQEQTKVKQPRTPKKDTIQKDMER
jgi:hypothetical protein